MRLVVLALVTSLGCSGTFGSTTRIVPPVKSPREPVPICGTPALKPSVAEQAALPVAVFLVGAIVVGGAYLAIGGDAP